MARIRTIKPEFFTSEQVSSCSLPARLLFVGMWCFCDDAGVHPASYKRLKLEVFPGDEIPESEIRQLVKELIEHGLLYEYESQGKLYWHVTGWKHQKIDKPNYRFPLPPEEQIRRPFDDHSTNGSRTVADHSTTSRRVVDDHSTTSRLRNGIRNGMEGNGDKPPTPLQGDVCNSDTPEPVDPNFDPRVQELWDGIQSIAQEVEPDRDKPRLTPYRRVYASKSLGMHSVSDLLSAWRWTLSSGSEKARAIREKWKGVDTFLRPENVTGYVEMAKADGSRASPRNAWYEGLLAENRRQDEIDRIQREKLAKETPEDRERANQLLKEACKRIHRTSTAAGHPS